jgi:hypothetical protein
VATRKRRVPAASARPPSRGGDAPEARDLVEQLGEVVRGLRPRQRADRHVEQPLARAGDQGGARRAGRRGRGRLRRGRLLRRGRGDRRGRHGGRGGRSHGRRRGHAIGQRADPCDQLAAVDRRTVAGAVTGEQLLQHVARLEQRVDHAGRRGQLVAAQLVEQRLHHVGQVGDVLEPEGRRAALDRVRAAEDRVQRLVVGSLDVEPQQQRLHVGEVLPRLLEEHAVELRQVERPPLSAGLCLAHVAPGDRITAAAPCR